MKSISPDTFRKEEQWNEWDQPDMKSLWEPEHGGRYGAGRKPEDHHAD